MRNCIYSVASPAAFVALAFAMAASAELKSVGTPEMFVPLSHKWVRENSGLRQFPSPTRALRATRIQN